MHELKGCVFLQAALDATGLRLRIAQCWAHTSEGAQPHAGPQRLAKEQQFTKDLDHRTTTRDTVFKLMPYSEEAMRLSGVPSFLRPSCSEGLSEMAGGAEAERVRQASGHGGWMGARLRTGLSAGRSLGSGRLGLLRGRAGGLAALLAELGRALVVATVDRRRRIEMSEREEEP